MGMEDLLQAILGGAAATPPGQSQGMDDPLSAILGGILGGGSAGMPGGQSNADPFQGFEGGSAGGISGGGLGDILGMILGGGGTGGENGFVSPIADGLAAKFGIPREIAFMIVAFLLNKLFSGSTAERGPTPGKSAQPEGLDLDSLLETLGGGQAPTATDFRQSGMAQEIAAQTGLDQQTAEQALAEAAQMLGGQINEARAPRPSNRPSAGGLDSLLESW